MPLGLLALTGQNKDWYAKQLQEPEKKLDTFASRSETTYVCSLLRFFVKRCGQ